MIALLVAALAAAPASSTPYVKAWTHCVAQYALPRLATEAAETIVDGGLSRCTKEEAALHRIYIRDNGQRVGDELFAYMHIKAREHMIAMVKAAKAQRGFN